MIGKFNQFAADIATMQYLWKRAELIFSAMKFEEKYMPSGASMELKRIIK